MSTETPPPGGKADAEPDWTEPDWEGVQASPEFQALRNRLRRFVFPLTVAFLVWYLAYVLLASYAPAFMAIPVLGVINLGLILGLLQFVSTFAITTWYVRWADKRFDPHAKAIRDEIEEGRL